MNSTLVVLDIDFVIFNSDIFMENFMNLLIETFDIKNKDLFLEEGVRAKKDSIKKVGYFLPEVFIVTLKNYTLLKSSVSKLEDLFFDESLFVNSVYEYSQTFFRQLVIERDIKINIFYAKGKKSYANKLVQLRKTFHKNSMHLTISAKKSLRSFLEKHKKYKIYLIDDSPNLLQEAKKFNPNIITIWLKTGVVQDFKPDFIATNLIQIVPFIVK